MTLETTPRRRQLVAKPRGPRLVAAPPAGTDCVQALASMLERLDEYGVLPLPHTDVHAHTGTSTRVAVATSGVWVVAAKRYAGSVELAVDDVPGQGVRLLVNGRDRTALVERLTRQVDAVGEEMWRADLGEIPVRGALCFVDTALAPHQRPLEVRDCLVAGPVVVKQRLLEHGPLDADDRIALHRFLARALAPEADEEMPDQQASGGQAS